MKGEPFEIETEVVAKNYNGTARSPRFASNRSSLKTANRPRPSTAPPDRHPTDLGNSERLVERHGQNLKHVRGLGWLVWDGKRWATDETGEVERCAKDTVLSIYQEAAAAINPTLRAAISQHAVRSEHVNRIGAMVKLAQSDGAVVARIAEFDADPWLLNVRNGTLDLRTGALAPHGRSDLIRLLTDVEYDAAARAPLFERFLCEVQPDQAMREYLQRLVGYALTGVVRDHVLPIHYGTGHNGKSTLTGALQFILGDYAKQIPTELLMSKKHDAHPTERAVLLGCRFAAATETEQNRHLNIALVKQLTGGDRIAARKMHKDFFEFDPTHKLWLTTNHRPVIKETKDAIWRRVHLIPWSVKIDEGRQEKALPEKLKAEAPGILQWALAGCLEWQRIGLAPPGAVLAATADYRADSDTIGDFLAAHCVLDQAGRITRATLRNVYEGWCAETGDRHPLADKSLCEELRSRGLVDVPSMREPGRKSPTKGWAGIRLRTPEDDAVTYPDVATPSGTTSHATQNAENTETVATGAYVATPPASSESSASTLLPAEVRGAAGSAIEVFEL